MSTRAQQTEAPGLNRSIKPVAVSSAVGVVFCALLLLLMSVVVATQEIPQGAIEPMAIFALSAGAFVSGYLCAKAMKVNGLLYGAICGVVIVLIVLIAGTASGSGGLGIPALFRVVFVMIAAMLGGVVKVNTGRKRKIGR